MKLKLSSVFLLLAAIVFFSACEKEKSFENGLPPGAGAAIFTLGGSPSSCTGFVAGGSYTAGTALIANNTVTADVNVTTTGSYSITTAAVNGVIFSTTGNFTTTGAQTVTLQGAGTASVAGDFTYTVSNGTTSDCNLIITVVPAGPVASATLDCANITSAGSYTQGVALAATNTVSIPVTVATAGSYSISTTANGCTFSGSGTLATGNQTIVLTGSGIPANSGSISFSISFGTSNCNFSIDFLPGTTAATDFLRCSIDGVATTFNANLIAAEQSASVGSGFSIDGFKSSATNSASLSLNLTNLGGTIISTGTYDLFVTSPPSTIFCYPIYDDGMVSWNQSINNQPGTFTIIVITKTINRITGTFSGTLYGANGNGPAIKTFTNGEFSVPY